MKLKYITQRSSDQNELGLLTGILENETNPDVTVYYAEQLISAAEKMNNLDTLFIGYLQLGNGHSEAGRFELSVESYYTSLSIASKIGDDLILSQVYGSLANLYSVNRDSRNAIRYYYRTLNIAKKLRNEITLTQTYFNLGNQYYQMSLPDSSDIMLDSASLYVARIDDLSLKQLIYAYISGNRQLNKFLRQDYHGIEKAFEQVFGVLYKLEDSYGICEYKSDLSKLYEKNGDLSKAIQLALESYELATEKGLKTRVMEASERLANLYRLNKNSDFAFQFLEQYYTYKDSILSSEATQRIADLRTEFEVGQKQAEVDVLTAQQKNQKIITWAVTAFAFILVILAAIIYKYYQSKTKTNKILEGQKKQLETLNATKDKFFSIISHDLRGPISAFQGVSRMIEFAVKTKNTDELMELAKDIDESADRLSNLLDSLLSWALQQQGHFPNVPEKVDLQLMANELQSTFKNTSNSKRVKFNVDIQPNLQLWVDRNTTQTIIRNLINNSLKFTEEGGTVTLQARSQDNKAEIRVEDTGVGMDEDKLQRLFKLHEKKSTYGTSGEKGLGLGLQLVYEFVEMNKGTIQVESKENKGTTFIIELPLYDSDGLLEPVQ